MLETCAVFQQGTYNNSLVPERRACDLGDCKLMAKKDVGTSSWEHDL